MDMTRILVLSKHVHIGMNTFIDNIFSQSPRLFCCCLGCVCVCVCVWGGCLCSYECVCELYICLHSCLRVCVYVCVYVCVWVCLYSCVCVCLCTQHHPICVLWSLNEGRQCEQTVEWPVVKQVLSG